MFWWMDPIPALLELNLQPLLDAFTLNSKNYSAVTLSNDYGVFTSLAQMYTLFSLKYGSHPLFVPWFWHGQSVTSNTLIQLWHPITLILPHFDVYWQGGALKMASFVQVLSLGLGQAFLYLLLRKLAPSRFLAFIFSFIAIYNIRMLESFRYQASLEAYTGMIFTCVAIGFFYLSFSRRNTFWNGLLITFSTYWLVTSGHPQFMFYGFMATCAFLLLFPWLVCTIRDEQPKKELLKFYCFSIFYIFIGIILASIYVVPYYFEFLQDNSARARASYEDLRLIKHSFWHWIRNFISPLDTDVVSNGAFGASPAYLYAVILAVYACLMNYKNKKMLFWYGGCLLFCSGIFLLALGASTPVHRWFCEHLPFFGMLRFPGRIAVVLPLFLSLLGWTLAAQINDSDHQRNFIRAIGIFIVVFIILSPFLGESPTGYIPSRLALRKTGPLGLIQNIDKLKINNMFYVLYIVSAFQFMLIFSKSKYAKRRWEKILTFAVTAASCGILMMQCNWVRHPPKLPPFAHLLSNYSQGKGLGEFGSKLESSAVTIHKKQGHTFDKNFASLFWSADVVPNVKAYYATIPKEHKNLVLISPKIPSSPSKDETKSVQAHLKLEYFSFNRFTISVTSDKPGWMKINYAYSKRWHAYANGKAVPVYRANGAEMAVPIQAGTQFIEFYYDKTISLAGMAITCVTLFFLFICCVRHIIPVRNRPVLSLIFYLASAFCCIYIFYTYDSSIYGGQNIPYSYSRSYPEVTHG